MESMEQKHSMVRLNGIHMECGGTVKYCQYGGMGVIAHPSCVPLCP